MVSYHEYLIQEAKKTENSYAPISDFDDLSILAEIHHYGAATFLIDFSYNALTALYFACEQPKAQGKVFCLNFNKIEHFYEVTALKEQLTIRELLEFNQKENKVWIIKPGENSNRGNGIKLAQTSRVIDLVKKK